jgi:hypothetical protein
MIFIATGSLRATRDNLIGKSQYLLFILSRMSVSCIVFSLSSSSSVLFCLHSPHPKQESKEQQPKEVKISFRKALIRMI